MFKSDSPDWPAGAHEALARFKPVASVKNRLVSRSVALACRVWMRRLNTLTLEGEGELSGPVRQGRGLLTFSNHVSLFDDPLLTSCMSGLEWSSIRWIASDALNFFGTPMRAAIFNGGKCVPIVRGVGVDQPGMRFLAERLTAGDWVHLFPEGGRTREPDGRLQLPLKTGLAELVRASAPVLLPFHHVGMREVLPIGSRFPRVGQTVRVRFGSAVDSRDGLAQQSMDEITAWATEQLLDLQGRAS